MALAEFRRGEGLGVVVEIELLAQLRRLDLVDGRPRLIGLGDEEAARVLTPWSSA